MPLAHIKRPSAPLLRTSSISPQSSSKYTSSHSTFDHSLYLKKQPSTKLINDPSGPKSKARPRIMHFTTPSSALLSTLALLSLSTLAFLSLPTLSAASPVNFLPARQTTNSAGTQYLLCTVADQTAIAGYAKSCKYCNCFCIADAMVDCTGTCTGAENALLQELSTNHSCDSESPQYYWSPHITNDAVYDQDVLEKKQY
ncbi:hypothetical protein MMC18_008602 [Xylographa bjoerkii]|nr:hypothetical protein [Xylographa bjoerkii]